VNRFSLAPSGNCSSLTGIRPVGLRLLSRQIWSAGNLFALHFHRDFPSLAVNLNGGKQLNRWSCPRAPDLVIHIGAIAGKDFHQARIKVLLVACEPFSRSSLTGSPPVDLLPPGLCKRREQSISALGTLLHCKGA
jgi:hypothetical protein